MNKYYKKLLLFCSILLFSFSSFALGKQSSQILQSGHWIYDDLTYLTTESKTTMYLETQPLSVGEINFFLKNINYDNLSSSGKAVYDRVYDFLNDRDNFIQNDYARLFVNLKLNPELYYKSNENINWSFNPNFVDYPITFPIIIGFSDYFTVQTDLFIGKHRPAGAAPDNFTNIPTSGGQLEFATPNFAYFSGAKLFENWGITAHMGKQGKKIGNTSLGSIIYNDTFDTDFYSQLNLFNRFFKLSMDVIQVDNSKFLYTHELTLRPFKNFNISVVEGSLLNAPFELRYLNPLMLMHSFGSWIEYDKVQHDFYGESNFCAYLAFTLEYIPIKNMRIYALYAQNEILDLGGSRSPRALSVPDSLGGQLGIEYYIPMANSSLIKTGLEAVYTSPFLYVKHSPVWSMFRIKDNMQSSQDSYSWLGSPFGPDCFALQASVDYDSNKKWSVGLDYTFSIHGENTAENLFNEKNMKDDGFWYYYPSVKYDKNTDQNVKDAAVKESRNMWMSGTKEYKNQIKVNGNYKIFPNLELTAQFAYTFAFNNKNIKDNFQQGVELAFALSCQLF